MCAMTMFVLMSTLTIVALIFLLDISLLVQVYLQMYCYRYDQ